MQMVHLRVLKLSIIIKSKKVRNDKGYTLAKKMEEKNMFIKDFYDYKGDKRTLLNNAIEGELGLAILNAYKQLDL